MKRQVRHSVFETNSSSTHSLTICSEEKFEAWKKGEILFNSWSEKFENVIQLTDSQREDAKIDYEDKKETFWKDWDSLNEKEKEKWYSKYAKENDFINDGYITYEDWCNNCFLEKFVETYTTDGGEKIVAFGKYGYDG